MCEECEEIEPLTVAYYGKVPNWRPPRQASTVPVHDDRLVTGRPYSLQPDRFICTPAPETK